MDVGEEPSVEEIKEETEEPKGLMARRT